MLIQVFLHSLFSILPVQATPQNPGPNSEIPRTRLNQEQLCCFDMHFVEPIYPKEARLTHTEGVVKVFLVFAADGSIADLQAVSGDPLLLDATMKAVRQWRFLSTIGGVGDAREIEVPLTFAFKIEDPPTPAYLHLGDGKVIRADTVHEFTDRIEYTVGRRTHRISSDSVTHINACARISVLGRSEGDCAPGGGPSFNIFAIPLLPAGKTSHSGRPLVH